MRYYIKVLSVLFLAVMLFGFQSCKWFKGTKAELIYQNITARYNGYFNAREKLKEVENILFESHPDNYNTILTVFPVGDEQTAKSIVQDVETVIKKCSRVIQKKERSRWIDDSYFLVGKANFYKRDYFIALETFEFLEQRYAKEPAGQEAPLWITRTYMQQNKMNEAQARISSMKLNKKLPEHIKQQLHLVEAEYFIKTEDYKQALEQMEAGYKFVKKKKYKARYLFIMAQLSQRLGSNDKSAEYYKAVIKKNPAYDQAFQAKLGLAEVSDDRKEVEKYLTSLIKDDKNISYNDQIYYILAKNEFRDNNIEKAIEYLNLSVGTSQKNNNQKSLSYLMLADIYFSRPNYPMAKAYYDSAANIVDKNFPGYEQFKNRQQVLSELIGNLIVIQREDSLLKLAQMPRNELDALVRDIAKQEKEQAQLKQLDNQNKQNNIAPNNNFNTFSLDNNQSASTTAGGYFYNATALSLGYSTFKSKWGDRPLADDWRRLDKPMANLYNPNNPTDTFITNRVSKDTVKFNNDNNNANRDIINDVPLDLRQYYTNIPFTASLKSFSNNRLQEAMFNAGTIYFQKLKENEKAIEMYEELLRRFPDNKFLLQTRYNLYRIYTEENEKAKAEAHKQFILKNYPGSDYAQLIENPDQLRNAYASRNKNVSLENLYSKTFEAFKLNDCRTVADGYDESKQINKNYLQPKFDYLYILCQYKNDSSGRLIDSLQAFTKRYPGDEVTKQAVILLEYLQRKKSGFTEAPKEEVKKEKTVYTFDEKLPHYYMFIFPADVDDSKLKSVFSDYNSNNYSSLNLDMSTFMLDDKHQILVIKNFVNFIQAYNYYDKLLNDVAFYPELGIKDYSAHVITDQNFRTLVRTKDVNSYKEFFISTY